MLMQILTHTPRWVFFLFAALVWLGFSQMAGRRATLRRVTLLPVAMLALSFFGVVSSFAGLAWALLPWAAGVALSAAAVLARPVPEGTAYEPGSRRFALPGSALPLGLMMGIFLLKYAVGVSLAMAPELASSAGYATLVGAVSGALSGVFLGRAARLWRLALPTLSQAPGVRLA
ncbi:DUF6622 family protein [Ideonella sp. YS5]|uniref:DUF6622 family protein n=1 Tax=Ideonella sp. YS5 TaxID=3453714 RepID=UPI003EEDDCAF